MFFLIKHQKKLTWGVSCCKLMLKVFVNKYNVYYILVHDKKIYIKFLKNFRLILNFKILLIIS